MAADDFAHEMAKNIVQSLNENRPAKRGRGRPRSKFREVGAALYPDVRSRTGIYNKWQAAALGVAAIKLGLVDGNYCNLINGRRMGTKFVELARLFGDAYWESDGGRDWLQRNWPMLAEMTVDEVRAWVRENNPRAHAPA